MPPVLRFSVTFVVLIALACTSTRDRGLQRRVERMVDEAVSAPLAANRFSGVVLVEHEGKTLVRKGYGVADIESGELASPDHGFMIMSVSKQFTAALIARLAAAGKLRLTDRVSKYLEQWPAEWDGVTIQHLLTHSSGLDIDTTYFWLISHRREYWPESAPPPTYVRRPLLAEPGSRYEYANVGYTLLSIIASKAGGKPFDELMSEMVFEPLGLKRTIAERRTRVHGRARGHERTESGLVRSEQQTIDIVGAGDLVSTADDLAKFNAAFENDLFLPEAIRQAMFTPHVRTPANVGIGYGWFIRTNDAGDVIAGHAGSGAGFRAFNYRVPAARLTVVVLSNVEGGDFPWVLALVNRVAAEVQRADDERDAEAAHGLTLHESVRPAGRPRSGARAPGARRSRCAVTSPSASRGACVFRGRSSSRRSRTRASARRRRRQPSQRGRARRAFRPLRPSTR